MKKIVLMLICCLFAGQLLKAQTTKVYVLRHAEKSTVDPNDRNPSLAPEGKERADSLVSRFSGTKIDAIFSTEFKRTRETVTPLSLAQKVDIHQYLAAYTNSLADLIKKEYRGKTVVVVGHSDTVLPFIEALGAQRPMQALSDKDYDNLFTVTIDNNVAKATAEKFGKNN
jgi:2,3-bisphosphoglycerate-dependent phosphoglycerate mutase